MEISNTYVTLGDRFYQKSTPTPVTAPELFLWNSALADQVNIPRALQEDSDALAQYFSGNQLLAGSEPISTVYAGHQFGGFNPQLGDGRAHLLGEVMDQAGKRWELQLKGSGPSAFSRGGDGRCALGPAIREFVMSEALTALGVPTTQCLAVVTTGERVYRQQPHPGAVVTRMASSHLRVGTFQFFAARNDVEALASLCDFAIQRHYPLISQLPGNRYVLLLDQVIEKQIELIVEWMRVGFIHGVMNTDNTAISGETIDFGPCAMMGVYDPATVFSSIDERGRYAFGNQAPIGHWNMARFAECLLPLIDQDDEASMGQITALIEEFQARYLRRYWAMMAKKCGIDTLCDDDNELITGLLEQLAERKLDYTISFDLMTRSLTCDTSRATIERQLGEVYRRWRARVCGQDGGEVSIQASMRSSNPVVIPRNHHVEAVLAACEASGAATPALEMLEVLRQPYSETENTERYQSPPEDGDRNYQTFCGT